MTIEVRHPMGGVLKRKGRADVSTSFSLGITRPVAGVNVGWDTSLGTLDTYTGPSAGGLLTINTPRTYTGIDFGTTQFRFTSNDVIFENCKLDFSKISTVSSDAGPLMDCTGNFNGIRFYRTEFTNHSQWAPALTGIKGEGWEAEQCWFHNLPDAFSSYVASARAGQPVRVKLLGCLLEDLAWYGAPTSGVVHPSDVKTHNDLGQHQGGTGLHVEGCDFQAFYSETVGTGTPNSGNNTAGTNASFTPYTQAEGQNLRYSIVEGGGTYSPGQPGAKLGGSISALMFNSVGRGSVVDGVFKNNWGGGGSYWMNAGDTGLTGVFGEISGNRLTRTMRNISGGNPVGFGLRSSLTATVTGNTWVETGATINRTNA